MFVKVKKEGNNLSLKIPCSIADKIGIKPESEVELRLENDRLVIVPQKNRKLDELIEQITSENLHSEVDWGNRVGKEVW